MIIVMKKGTEQSKVARLIQELESKGMQPVPLYGVERTVIAVIGDERILDEHHISSFPGVSKVMSVLRPYKLASRETQTEPTIIDVKGIKIGGKTIAMMAGPCSVESEDQIMSVAKDLSKMGVKILRGGAFKPRTGPYSFEGLGEEGLRYLRQAANKYDMAIVTEVMEIDQIEKVAEYADILQIGTRNMQNFNLLKAVGKTQKPIFLKRGMSATITEFLLAAEYILSNGNPNVMLCERGIRTFETETRNTLALATVPLLKELTHLPIIVDPSHGTGKKSLVAPMVKAAIAAGADGIMVEVHPNPEEALSDGDQSLTPEEFKDVMKEARKVALACDREL
ncbi:MAG: 3-deoxy-7-phosphoheptulonate synthase [Patescibacteria group bacterium]|nr:3-deoxy-7-phosphoheptulonate synthase [Patescibacteria group bacterium]